MLFFSILPDTAVLNCRKKATCGADGEIICPSDAHGLGYACCLPRFFKREAWWFFPQIEEKNEKKSYINKLLNMFIFI